MRAPAACGKPRRALGNDLPVLCGLWLLFVLYIFEVQLIGRQRWSTEVPLLEWAGFAFE